jgi:hypothetical protein
VADDEEVASRVRLDAVRSEQQSLFGAQADRRIYASRSPGWKRTCDGGHGEHGGHDGDKDDRIKRPYLE